MDKFRKGKSNFATTLVTGIGTGTSETITLNSTAGLPTDTEIVLTFNRVTSSGVVNPTSLVERIRGKISGSTLTAYTRGVDDTTEQAHSAGTVVEYIYNAKDLNDMVDGILVEHEQDGTHKSAVVTTLKATGAEVTAGTEDAKIVTPKALKDANIVAVTLPAKASGADINTGTDDSKFATPKALKDSIIFNAPEGFLLNGKIVPSVTSNNLTVAIKGLDGNDPSATNPVYIRIGDTIRSITSALSVTKNAGTNWFNAGSAELATKEIDYFVYLGYNATDGVVIGFSRIPYATEYSQFSTTSTNEKYCAISTITNATSGDDYVVIGRFAATLSAGAGYTWTVPAFDSKNLIQRPIFNTRKLTYTPVGSAAGSMTYTINTVYRATYQIIQNRIFLEIAVIGTTGGSANADLRVSTPMSLEGDSFSAGYYKDSTYSVIIAQANSGGFMQTFKTTITNWGIGAGKEIYQSVNGTLA